MSERGLNDVLRTLRVAKEHLNLTEAYTETNLHDHNATARVHSLSFALSDMIDYFNVTYRESHYKKKLRR